MTEFTTSYTLEFTQRELPVNYRRVLEVGCGDGERWDNGSWLGNPDDSKVRV